MANFKTQVNTRLLCSIQRHYKRRMSRLSPNIFSSKMIVHYQKENIATCRVCIRAARTPKCTIPKCYEQMHNDLFGKYLLFSAPIVATTGHKHLLEKMIQDMTVDPLFEIRLSERDDRVENQIGCCTL